MLPLAPLLHRRSASTAALVSPPRQSPTAEEVERELATNRTRGRCLGRRRRNWRGHRAEFVALAEQHEVSGQPAT